MLAFIDPIEKIIRKRRSIRKYKSEVPSPGWIESIISCAALAPSPSNSQPVRFFRISSEQVKEKLHGAMIERRRELLEILDEKGGAKKTKNLINAYFRYSEFMFDAPVILAAGTVTGHESFSGKLREAGILPPETVRSETDLDISIGLALQSLMLKSEAIGLGTCILTGPLAFLPEVEKILGLEGVRVKCFITVGFPDESPAPVERKNLSEIYSEIE